MFGLCFLLQSRCPYHYTLCYCLFCIFFFFKQKTAYEMRISDWSSDVCSSDLPRLQNRDASQARIPCPGCNNFKYPAITQIGAFVSVDSQQLDCFSHDLLLHAGSGAFGSTCSSRLRRLPSVAPSTTFAIAGKTRRVRIVAAIRPPITVEIGRAHV